MAHKEPGAGRAQVHEVDRDYVSRRVSYPNKAAVLITERVIRRDVFHAEAGCDFLELPIDHERLRVETEQPFWYSMRRIGPVGLV